MKHRPRLDIDQLLIFALLAVTVSQLAAFLSRYTPLVLAYAQAVAIDAAIWRCGFWFRRYTGAKQRRLALLGLVVFSLVSAWYNRNYYHVADPSLPTWQTWLMGAILPLGVALLSYLYGTKDASRFGYGQESRQLPISSDIPIHEAEPCVSPAIHNFRCVACSAVFATQNGLNAHQRAHGNGHERVRVQEAQDANDTG